MTKSERLAFKKLRVFTLLVRNRAPIGTLRSDAVMMTELIDTVFDPKRRTVMGDYLLPNLLSREWDTK